MDDACAVMLIHRAADPARDELVIEAERGVNTGKSTLT